MENSNTNQKKKFALNYLYAGIVAFLVIACAVTIALVSKTPTTTTGDVGEVVVPTATTTYVVPIDNATIQKDYSASELQYNDTLKQWEIHKAIDFLAGEDLKVVAVSDGTVSNVYTNYLEGTVVEISHKNGVVSVYKSLANEVKVAVGDKVTAGQMIGEAGSTMAQELNGGKHLHFEMSVNGAKVDPNDYISLGNK
ncbi:MAG: M23 family metallopeptidase [Clostridia bacterium]|nr:M23 family metallopeptidase [Clostridia bacterium]